MYQKKYLIAIIIVTYKSSHLIQKTLSKINNKDFKIIIVDNGSNDDIKEVLSNNIKNNEVEFIAFENNCGFGRANNYALKKIDSDYALILNPDCFIDPESVNEMVHQMKKDKNIALANPLFVDDNYQKNANDQGVEDISFVCGGAMMMRMDIFRKIGFFDENIFLYAEDDEISGRVKDFGYRSIIVKSATANHHGSNSSLTKSNKDDYKLLYFRSYHSGWGKTYLKKRNRNTFRIVLKSIHRLFLSLYYLIFELNEKKSIIRFGLFMGSMSNLLGIDCFNKNNKEIRLKLK